MLILEINNNGSIFIRPANISMKAMKALKCTSSNITLKFASENAQLIIYPNSESILEKIWVTGPFSQDSEKELNHHIRSNAKKDNKSGFIVIFRKNEVGGNDCSFREVSEEDLNASISAEAKHLDLKAFYIQEGSSDAKCKVTECSINCDELVEEVNFHLKEICRIYKDEKTLDNFCSEFQEVSDDLLFTEEDNCGFEMVFDSQPSFLEDKILDMTIYD